MYSVFNRSNNNALEEPMFLGNSVNVSRFDKQRYPFFEKLTEKQISFFWRPEEIDLAKDKIDFAQLTPHEQHIFISNLKYQTLLDSVQGRSPNVVLLPLTSLPELETWIETWAFYETIHSRSYTHILRNIFTEPSEVLDDIMVNENILKRAEEVSKYYDDLYQYSLDYHKGNKVDLYLLKKKLYLCLMAVNALEGIRFYVSFACSFAFAERKMMEGNAKIIKLIARDEQLHLNGTQHILSSGEHEIDLKLAAKISGNKKCDLIPMKELLPLTGYIRGGCSPIGMKKHFPTYIHHTCNDFPYIYVSAGVRGLQVKLAPADLIKVSQAEVCTLF
jgi:ribonucleoside-diphosphate reductase beta chain